MVSDSPSSLHEVQIPCWVLPCLQVNAYPAIASGTMAGVDRQVFTDLLQDLLTLVVLPVTDGAAPEPGGFVLLEV